MISLPQLFGLPSDSLRDVAFPKAFFQKHHKLSAAQKRLVNTSHLPLSSTWVASLGSKSGIATRPGDTVYTELQYFEVMLGDAHWKHVTALAQLYQQSIPYPVVLRLCCGTRCIYSTATKSLNLANKDLRKMETHFLSKEINVVLVDEGLERFLKSVNLKSHAVRHLYDLYDIYCRAITAYNASRETGNYDMTKRAQAAQADLDRLKYLRQRLSQVEQELKKTRQMAQRVALATERKQLKDQEQKLLTSL